MLSVFPDTKTLFSFAGRFVVMFFLILPLWFIFTPAYNRLLAFSANTVFRVTERSHTTTLVSWKHDILVVPASHAFTEGMKLQGFTGYLTHFNLLLLVALVFATQQSAWWRRCKFLAVALGVLFLTHVLYLVIGVKFFQQPELAAFQSASGRLYVWGVHFYLSMASQLLPVVIWLALYRTIGGIPRAENTEPEAATRHWCL